MKTSNNQPLNRRLISSSARVIISLSLVLFMVGLLALVVISAQRKFDDIKENIVFSIILEEGVNDMETRNLLKVLDAEGFVKSSSFISKEQAALDFQKELGENFQKELGEDSNPLPASINLKINANYVNNNDLQEITAELNNDSVVFETYYDTALVKKLNSKFNKLSFYLFSFAFVLFVIAFVLINNIISLSIYSKRFLIRTMRLVGATNSVIQKSFLVKGMFQGIYSSIFAIFLLIGSIQLIQNETVSMLNITDLKIIGLIFILIFILGILLNWVSTFFAVRKFIKQNENKLYN